MIITGCEGCCFLQSDSNSKRCIVGQMCAIKDGQAFAPGYCRMCRSHSWAKKQDTTEILELHKNVLNERELKFDMLVYFDEAVNTPKDLKRTLQSDWYIKYTSKVIIMDTTGFGNRKNIALQYIQTKKHPIPVVVDSSVEHELLPQREATIRRVSKQVTSPFFLVITAGNVIDNFEMFAMDIKYVYNRVIHWSFPHRIGNTTIFLHKLSNGLFITAPYKSLVRLPKEKSFTQILATEEEETEMKLSWLCNNTWLI